MSYLIDLHLTIRGVGALPLVVRLRSVRPARVARLRPPREAQKFFSLRFLKGSEITLMGSLRVSNGGALGKSCMQK